MDMEEKMIGKDYVRMFIAIIIEVEADNQEHSIAEEVNGNSYDTYILTTAVAHLLSEIPLKIGVTSLSITWSSWCTDSLGEITAKFQQDLYRGTDREKLAAEIASGILVVFKGARDAELKAEGEILEEEKNRKKNAFS